MSINDEQLLNIVYPCASKYIVNVHLLTDELRLAFVNQSLHSSVTDKTIVKELLIKV